MVQGMRCRLYSCRPKTCVMCAGAPNGAKPPAARAGTRTPPFSPRGPRMPSGTAAPRQEPTGPCFSSNVSAAGPDMGQHADETIDSHRTVCKKNVRLREPGARRRIGMCKDVLLRRFHLAAGYHPLAAHLSDKTVWPSSLDPRHAHLAEASSRPWCAVDDEHAVVERTPRDSDSCSPGRGRQLFLAQRPQQIYRTSSCRAWRGPCHCSSQIVTAAVRLQQPEPPRRRDRPLVTDEFVFGGPPREPSSGNVGVC